MKPFADVGDRRLHWLQPDPHQRHYQLLAGEDHFASLRWQKPAGSLALGETASGAWTLKRTGFLAPRVTVRLPGAAANLAVFKPGWRGEGTLEWIDGPKHYWVNLSFWDHAWAFTTAFNEPLIHVRPHLPPLARDPNDDAREVAEARIESAGQASPHLPVLTILGWYLLVLMHDDHAIATGAI